MEPSEREVLFRRMVSNTFRRLCPEDVQQIAYVRLKGREDTKKFSAAKPQATSLDLMESLEQYGCFSQENVDGLKEILKDANRSDLVKHVETEIRKLNKKLRNRPEPSAELLGSPTEELASKLGSSKWQRDEKQGWVVVPESSERVPPLHLGGKEASHGTSRFDPKRTIETLTTGIKILYIQYCTLCNKHC